MRVIGAFRDSVGTHNCLKCEFAFAHPARSSKHNVKGVFSGLGPEQVLKLKKGPAHKPEPFFTPRAP